MQKRQTPWDRIAQAMRDQGIKDTQKECAKLLGITQPSVSEWASADTAPSLQNAITLARKLNVCVEWIQTGEGPKRPGPPMEPAAQALWDAWPRIPSEGRERIVGFAEALAEATLRPVEPPAAKRARSAPARRTGS